MSNASIDPIQKLLTPDKTPPRFRPLKTLEAAAHLFIQKIRCFGAVSLGLIIGVIVFVYLSPHLKASLFPEESLLSLDVLLNLKIIGGFAFVIAAPWTLLAVITPKDFDPKKPADKAPQNSWPLIKSQLMDRRGWSMFATCIFWFSVSFLVLIPLKSLLDNQVQTTITQFNEHLPGGWVRKVIEKKQRSTHGERITRSARIVNNGENGVRGNIVKVTHYTNADKTILTALVIMTVLVFFWIRMTPLFGALADRRTRALRLSWHLSHGSFWRLVGGQVTWSATMLFSIAALKVLLNAFPTTSQQILGPILLIGFISVGLVWFLIYLGLTYRFLLITRPAIAQKHPQYAIKTPDQTPAPKTASKKPPLKKSPAKKRSPKITQPPQP